MVEDRPRAQHAPAPDSVWGAALAGLGLQDGKAQRIEYLWPENVPTWRVWQSLQTQWRVGMSGMTGLDYAAVAAHLTEIGETGESRRVIYDGVRVLEHATLAAMADRREG